MGFAAPTTYIAHQHGGPRFPARRAGRQLRCGGRRGRRAPTGDRPGSLRGPDRSTVAEAVVPDGQTGDGGRPGDEYGAPVRATCNGTRSCGLGVRGDTPTWPQPATTLPLVYRREPGATPVDRGRTTGDRPVAGRPACGAYPADDQRLRRQHTRRFDGRGPVLVGADRVAGGRRRRSPRRPPRRCAGTSVERVDRRGWRSTDRPAQWAGQFCVRPRVRGAARSGAHTCRGERPTERAAAEAAGGADRDPHRRTDGVLPSTGGVRDAARSGQTGQRVGADVEGASRRSRQGSSGRTTSCRCGTRAGSCSSFGPSSGPRSNPVSAAVREQPAYKSLPRLQE